MTHKKLSYKLVAAVLTLSVVIWQVPLTVLASHAEASTSGVEITAFASLADEVQTQTMSLSTALHELALPDTLVATTNGEDGSANTQFTLLAQSTDTSLAPSDSAEQASGVSQTDDNPDKVLWILILAFALLLGGAFTWQIKRNRKSEKK